MSFDAHANLASSLVVVAPSPQLSGTSLTVVTGQGALFPAAPFNCTVCPANTMPTQANAEIVRVTAVVGDTLTITRAQEGTSAKAIAIGYFIANSITAKDITDIETAVDGKQPTGSYADSGDVTASGLTMNTNKLLGRGTAGTGVIEEITLGSNLSLSGNTLNATGGGSFPAFDDVQTVYVNKGGNDGTADGTPVLPFLTIQAALDSILDASSSKLYLVSVGPGTYLEDLTAIPSFVKIQGAGDGLTVLDSPSGAPFAFDTTSNGYNEFADLSLARTSGSTIDIQGPSGSNQMLYLTRLGVIAGKAIYLKDNSSGGLYVRDSVGLVMAPNGGTINIVGGTGQFTAHFGGASTVNISQFQSANDLNLNGEYNAYTLQVVDSFFPSVTLKDNITISIQPSCFPDGQLTITSGSPTVTYINALPTTPVQTQIVYVSKGGDDMTADGSLALPFLTVKAAVDSIVDSSPTKAYVVTIGPGEYEEADFTLPENVHLSAWVPPFSSDFSGGGPTSLTSASLPLVITIDTANSTKTKIYGLGFAGVSFAGCDGTSQELNAEMCEFSDVVFGPTITSLFVVYCSLGNAHPYGPDCRFYYSLGTISLDDSASLAVSNMEVVQCYGSLILDPPDDKFPYVLCRRSFFVTLDAAGDGLTLDLDKGSSDGAVNITGGSPTITYTNTPFTPANSGDWSGDPTTEESAIDRIAAAVAGLLSGPIP